MLFLFFACSGDSKPNVSPPPIDLTSSLSETEVRGGEITDVQSLIGGVSAEGRIGDFKLYNNKAQFVIQGIRPSNYYLKEGGGLLDADIIRPSGQIGRDVIDEHTPMIGFGRIFKPTSATVVDDGSSGTAHLRVQGTGSPFALIEGTLESFNLVPDVDLDIQVDYRLKPDSYLLEIETTAHWRDDNAAIQTATMMLVGKEVTEVWNPGGGLNKESNGQWYGSVGQQNEIALGLFPSDGPFASSSFQSLLEDATPAMSAFGETFVIEEDTIYTMTHYVGVGRDLAVLTDEFYEKTGESTQELSGVVTSDGNLVAGARVHLYDGEEAVTLAFTDENGEWSAKAPADRDVSTIVSGRGHAKHYDLPTGAGWYPPYGDEHIVEATKQSIEQGSLPIPFAEGYGVSDWNSSELAAPGVVTISTTDEQPAVVLVRFQDGDPVPAATLVPSRPSGLAAIGYIRDGDIDIPLEAGDYTIHVHRGLTCEYHEETLSIAAGGRHQINATINCVDLPDNIHTVDPHTHSSASGDGKISMSGRVLTHAAHGVEYHVSTEHDHIIDFQPLIDSLGLTDQLNTIVGSEVSPTLKGHHNSYPLTPDAEYPNFNAPLWWEQMITTPELYEMIRAVQPPNGIIQANHPTGSSGLFSAADWDLASAQINAPLYWDSSFDAMELINDGYHAEYLPRYFDLISRGYEITPIGVSDSHSNTGGVGETVSFVHPAANTEKDLLEALKRQRVVPSNGPYIHATVDGSFAPGSTFSGVQIVDVSLYHPSWMKVDNVVLYENGVEVQSLPFTGEAISFDLSPDEDAHYSVVARGQDPMYPVYGAKPWAITAAIKIDLAGDGWQAPLPPLLE